MEQRTDVDLFVRYQFVNDRLRSLKKELTIHFFETEDFQPLLEQISIFCTPSSSPPPSSPYPLVSLMAFDTLADITSIDQMAQVKNDAYDAKLNRERLIDSLFTLIQSCIAFISSFPPFLAPPILTFPPAQMTFHQRPAERTSTGSVS